ncbi:MEDS domain-containing protein [bacterium]|nr:MEDS domain-containing protein [bacterium]
MIKVFPMEYQQAIKELKPHEHVVLVFDSSVEQREAIEPLVQSHIADGKSCVYLSAGERFFDGDKHDERVAIYDPAEWAKGSTLSDKSSSVINHITKVLETSKEGDVVLLLEEMQWLNDQNFSLKEILGYEAEMDRLVNSQDVIRVCQYNRQSFAPELLLEILNTHKLVIYQKEIFTNPFYTPPEKLNPSSRANNEVERMLSGLKDLKHWESELIFTIKNLNYLVEINKTISGSVDLDQVVNEVINSIVSHLNPAATRVMIAEPDTGTLRLQNVRGFLKRYPKADLAMDRDTSFWQKLVEADSSSVLLSRAEGHLLLGDFRDEKFETYFAALLIAKGAFKGVVDIFLTQTGEEIENWRPFIEPLVHQLAIAIDNAQAYENLQQKTFELTMAYDTTMARFAQVMDQRENHISRNTQRLAEMTERLARSMGASDEEVVDIRRGVLLEDIGKLSLLDKILEKPGPLSDKEWQIVHEHPMVVFNLLEDLSILRPALEIPYCHNEHWDGSGYPRGLKGDEIPLAARQFAVVNVYDALLADRPYRPSWDEVDALAYIQSLAGTQFDPSVVTAFFNMLEKAD